MFTMTHEVQRCSCPVGDTPEEGSRAFPASEDSVTTNVKTSGEKETENTGGNEASIYSDSEGTVLDNSGVQHGCSGSDEAAPAEP